MSWYTDQAVTVDAEHAEAFLALLRALAKDEDEHPDSLHRDGAGRVTAVWSGWNHFDSSATGRALEAFLDDLEWEDYFMEVFDEDYGHETRGGGCIGFYAFIGFDAEGEEVVL
jgi:hypothetical protein